MEGHVHLAWLTHPLCFKDLMNKILCPSYVGELWCKNS